MGYVWSELFPLILGAIIVPLWIIIVLLMLQGERGVRTALAFVAGATFMRLVQGILFGFVFASSSDDNETIITSVLLIVVGILLWITSLKKWRKEEDPDAPPPQWMASLSSLGPLKAFGMGALLTLIAAKMWVFTLSAVSVVQHPDVSTLASIAAYLVYVVSAVSLLLLAILYAALAPTQAKATLGKASNWLEKNNRVIVIAVSAIFGAYFLWKGISGLI